MNGKRILVVTLLLLGLVGLVLLISKNLRQSVSNQENQVQLKNELQETQKPANSGNHASFKSSSTTWQNQNQYEVEVVFDNDPEPYPTAFTLQILFDPNILRVDEITTGNLWSGENVLETKIDNDEGVVKFSVGQGFDKDITNQKVLAKLKITVIDIDPNNLETSLTLGPESATATAGMSDRLIKLESSAIKIELTE